MRYEEWLRDELRAWVAEGLVTSEQADAIRRRYREGVVPARRNRVVETLATVGGIVAGAGVVLFFAANWDGIARPARVALLFLLVVASYGGGFLLRDVRRSHPLVGSALLLLGGVAFGASLFLVGQMYHVQAHDPLAFLALAAGAGATAWIARSQPLATLALAAGGAWMAYEAAVAGPGDDVDTMIYLPIVSALYGTGLYGVGTGFAERLGPFGAPARRLGAFLGVFGAFVFTFRGVFGDLDERDPLGALLSVMLALLALAAVGGAAALLRSGRATGPFEASAIVATTALVVLAVVFPESTADGDALLYPILFNLLVAAVALGAVVVGYANDEPWLVTLGLVWVGVDLVARYLDFFWDMLPRSLVFIGVGAVILLLALVLERQRKGLVERMGTR